MSQSGFVVKHARICIRAHVITQTVAVHLFSLNTCMQIPPPFFFSRLRKKVAFPPTLGAEREAAAVTPTSDRQTAVNPQKGPAAGPVPVAAGADGTQDPLLSPELLWKASLGEEAPAGPGGDPAGALILSTVAKGLLVSGIIQQHGRSR